MLFPVVSSASTTEDLQRQIISLLTQLITLLEAQIAAAHPNAESQQPVNMCPPAPLVPVGVNCAADWQKIQDAQSCHIGWSCVVYSAIVQGKTVQPPIISAIQGPTDILLSTSGTWKVTATSPSHEGLSYSIIWGDEGPNISKLLDLSAQGAGNYTSSKSFSHSYSGEGVYTIIVFVKDEDGNTSKATMVVYVQPPPPPPAPPSNSSSVVALACTVGGTSYPEGTRLASLDLFSRGSGHSTILGNVRSPVCAYVIGPNPNIYPSVWPYYYTCRAGRWTNDNGIEYCSMLVPPALQWRYQYFVDVMPDFCRIDASPDIGSCAINGQQYQEGQSYYFRCPLNARCVADPGWRVCRGSSWTPATGERGCSPGYGWCGAGVGPALSCMPLQSGHCPAVL